MMDFSQSSASGTLRSLSTYSSGSKSGSSKSGHSIDRDKDRDLTKDNAASPIDLECHIQAERITKILDEAIFKTKLALTLPNLVQEYKTLESALTSNHMDDLVFIFEQYDNPLFSASLLNLGALEDLKQGDVSLKNRLNPELGHLLYIMNSYPAIKPRVEELVEEMKITHQSDSSMRFQFASLEYLLALEHFRDLMVTQMATTAAEELAIKINTRKLEGSNMKLIDKIKEYSTCLKVEQEQFETAMAQKAQIIAKLENELQILNHDANVRLKKKILDSERQMVLASRAHVVKYELLQEEQVEFRESYEALLKRDVMEEKNQRARRFKVETQLLSWLQKYDTEMGDKQMELDELEGLYEEELKKSEECEVKLAEQDKEYLPLMEEREEEYHREMEEKMNVFLKEHAARVIQNAWRDVLANRAEKKKLMKLYKQKEAEQKAAALAAEKEEERLKKEKKKNKKTRGSKQAVDEESKGGNKED